MAVSHHGIVAAEVVQGIRRPWETRRAASADGHRRCSCWRSTRSCPRTPHDTVACTSPSWRMTTHSAEELHILGADSKAPAALGVHVGIEVLPAAQAECDERWAKRRPALQKTSQPAEESRDQQTAAFEVSVQRRCLHLVLRAEPAPVQSGHQLLGAAC